MLKEAYTTQELAKIFTIAVKNVLAKAERENWEPIVRAKKLGGNLWLVSSMPAVTQTAIKAAIARQAEHLPAPMLNKEVSSSVTRDIVIPDYAWNRGKAKHRILREWQAYVAKQKTKGVSSGDATAAFLAALQTGNIVPPEVLKASGAVSVPTLYRWKKALRENAGDIEILADKRGGWLSGRQKGQGRISDEAEQAFLGVYLRPTQPNMQFAYNAMQAVLEKGGHAVPSYATVRRFFQRFDAAHHDLVAWMRYGEKVYADEVGSFLSRDDSILQVGDILIADGHKLNFTVKHPETGKACRMTLIGWQDWASLMFVGFEIMINENTQAISASLFRSIINLGMLPKAVYIDNGKAFKNKFFDGDADLEDFDGLYSRLGIYVQHSAPYVARTKVIERWWKDFDQQCAVGLPTYSGASIDGKPAYLLRNEPWHKRQQEKAVAALPAGLPTIADVVRIVTEFARWKAFQPHPSRPNTTPYEVFMAGRGPGFPTEEADKLTRHFLFRKPIRPRRCRFTLHGVEFESDSLHGINKELVAHYSYTDLSAVYVYDEGRLFCTAKPVTTVNPLAAVFGDEIDVEKVKAAQKRVAALRKETRRQASALAEWGAEADALAALPWMQPANERKVPLTLRQGNTPIAAPESEPEISDEERAAILAVTAAAQAPKPAYTPPAYFPSPLKRYEYLFILEHEENVSLTPEDAAFMRAFEAGPEWENVRKRYDQLREFFAAQEKTA